MGFNVEIDRSRLERGIGGTVGFYAEVFAYIRRGDRNLPGYAVFVDTTGYDVLFGETTGFTSSLNWAKRLYVSEIKLDIDNIFGVPREALEIPLEISKGNDEMCLRYRDASILLMPDSFYDEFFKDSRHFLCSCDVVYKDDQFLKGNEADLVNAGVRLE